jgi:BON domain
MRLSRAIPVLVAGAAAVWFLERRRLLPGQAPPALPWPPDPVPPSAEPGPEPEAVEEPPAPVEEPPAPDPGFAPSEQPTMEQPAVEPADAFGAEDLDVTAVVEDLIAPAATGREGAIVDAEIVDEADEPAWEGPSGDDQIAQLVREELAQLPGVPAGALSVEVVAGTAILRGEIDRPGTISELDGLVRQVDGVIEVRNLLHLPGTPPPA